jgi:pilus assembly protein CpaB
MRLIGLFISITLGLVTVFLGLQFMPQESQTHETQVVVEKPVEIVKPEPTRQVLVATRFIAPGTTIDASMIDRQDWPQRLLVPQFVIADTGNSALESAVDGNKQPSNIIGMIARAPFQPREPFMFNRLAKEGDPSFIASTLPNGQRIVTIATDGINGVAGFVYPGDRVDVLLTQNVELPPNPDQPNASPRQEQVTEPLLVNIPVIAVDQRSTSAAQEKPSLPNSVSLQVSPDDALKLRLAEKRGSLSLALRSLKDKDESIAALKTRYDVTTFYNDSASTGENSPFASNKMATPQEKDKIIVVRGIVSEELQFTKPEAAPAAPAQPQQN